MVQSSLGQSAPSLAPLALFREAKTALDDYNKSLDADAAAAAQSFDNSVQNMQDAVDNLAKAHATFIAQLGAAGGDNDPIATQIKNENALYDEQLKAIKKIIEAHDKLIGKTPEQIAADMSTIDEQKAKHNLDHLTREYLLRDANQTDLNKKADAAQKAQAEAAERLNNRTSERAKLEKDIPSLQKAASDAAQKAQDTPKEIVIPPASGFGTPAFEDNPAYVANQQAAQRAQDDLQRAMERHKQVAKEMAGLQTTKAQADSDAATSTEASISNARRVGDLNRQIPQQQDLDRTNAAGRSESIGGGIADQLASGAKVTVDQARYLTDLAATLTGHQVTLAQAVTVLETAVRNPAAMATQIDRITTILQGFDPSAIGRLNHRLDEIETQMSNHGP